jgi:predicted metalloendopeptidase
MTDEEQRMSFHEYTEHIMRKGEARERAQSILRERQSMISFAVGLLPPERIEQLQSMQDLDLLTKAIQAALRERVR